MLKLKESPRMVWNDQSPDCIGRSTRGLTDAVLIIEDHAMVLHALQATLRRLRPDVEQVCVKNASAALEVIGRRWFRVFLDPDASGVDESSLIHELAQRGLAPRCCVITTRPCHKVTPYLQGFECLTCMSTRMPIHEFDATLARTVLGVKAGKDRSGDDVVPDFTQRHVELLRLLQRGLPNKSIAHELGIAEGTVKNHLYSLMKLLGVRNRTQAAQAAARFDIAWRH